MAEANPEVRKVRLGQQANANHLLGEPSVVYGKIQNGEIYTFYNAGSQGEVPWPCSLDAIILDSHLQDVIRGLNSPHAKTIMFRDLIKAYVSWSWPSTLELVTLKEGQKGYEKKVMGTALITMQRLERQRKSKEGGEKNQRLGTERQTQDNNVPHSVRDHSSSLSIIAAPSSHIGPTIPNIRSTAPFTPAMKDSSNDHKRKRAASSLSNSLSNDHGASMNTPTDPVPNSQERAAKKQMVSSSTRPTPTKTPVISTAKSAEAKNPENAKGNKTKHTDLSDTSVDKDGPSTSSSRVFEAHIDSSKHKALRYKSVTKETSGLSNSDESNVSDSGSSGDENESLMNILSRRASTGHVDTLEKLDKAKDSTRKSSFDERSLKPKGMSKGSTPSDSSGNKSTSQQDSKGKEAKEDGDNTKAGDSTRSESQISSSFQGHQSVNNPSKNSGRQVATPSQAKQLSENPVDKPSHAVPVGPPALNQGTGGTVVRANVRISATGAAYVSPYLRPEDANTSKNAPINKPTLKNDSNDKTSSGEGGSVNQTLDKRFSEILKWTVPKTPATSKAQTQVQVQRAGSATLASQASQAKLPPSREYSPPRFRISHVEGSQGVDRPVVMYKVSNTPRIAGTEVVGDRPGVQRGGQPRDQPAHQPANQPAMQLASQPGSQRSGQPRDQPAHQPPSQSGGQPNGQLRGRSAHHPANHPATQLAGQPSGQHRDQPSNPSRAQPGAQTRGQAPHQPAHQLAAQTPGQPNIQPFDRQQNNANPLAGSLEKNTYFENHLLLIVNGLPFRMRTNSSYPDAWVYEELDGPLNMVSIETRFDGTCFRRLYVRADSGHEQRIVNVGGARAVYADPVVKQNYYVESIHPFMVGGLKYWLYRTWAPEDVVKRSGRLLKD